MKSFEIKILILSIAFNLVHGNLKVLGLCPKISGVSNLYVSAYTGNWFEVERYLYFPELTQTVGFCVSLQYTENENQTLSTELKMMNPLTNTGLVYSGVTHFKESVPTGDMNLKIKLLNFHPLAVNTISYKIIDTDYESYSINWICRGIPGYNYQTLWILTRNSSYPESVRSRVHEKVKSLGLNEQLLIRSGRNC